MSSEVCPFCGKTYKRLKSHLPHCKAAADSKTPPTEHRGKTDQTTSSSPPVAGFSEPASKEGKPKARPQSKNTTKVSASSPTPTQLSSPVSTTFKGVGTPSLSSARKKKPKLSEQIENASTPSSPAASLISPPALPLFPSPTASKPKKKSLRALIEASKSDQVTKGSQEGTRSASGHLPSGLTQFLADPLRSRTKAHTETSIIPDNTSFASPSADAKFKDAPKKKVSRKKKATESLSTSKDTDSESLASEINESRTRPHGRDKFWVDNDVEIDDLSVNNMLLKSGSAHQAGITIQDVKAMLGRAKTTGRSSGASIRSHIETTDNLSSKARHDTSFSLATVPAENQKDGTVVSCMVTTKTLSDFLPGTTSQHTELQSVKKKSSTSKQASLVPLQHDGSSQPKLNSPAAPLISGCLSSKESQATPPPRTVGTNEGRKVGPHGTRLPSIPPSPVQFSSPHLSPRAPQSPPARVETLRADDGSKLENRKQNMAHSQTQGNVTQRSLGQVRLGELPEWLACKTPSHPRDVVETVHRGWQWYYRRYIDVKKGGVGGLGMLLAGYCVLSYMWSYPHIKRDRWRKYH